MATTGPSVAGADSGLLTLEMIHTVMRDCNCTEQRAITLLRRSNNDVSKAKRHHQTYMQYLQMSKSASSTRAEHVSNHREPTSGGQRVPPEQVHGSSGDPRPAEEKAPKRSDPPLSSWGPSYFDQPARQGKRTQDTGTVSPFSHSNGIHLSSTQGIQSGLPIFPGTGQRAEERKTSNGKKEDGVSSLRDWDFVLPHPPFPESFPPGFSGDDDNFCPSALIEGVHHGATVEVARNYLNSYDPSAVKHRINEPVDGFPAIFYAVATKNEDMARLFIEFGGDVSAVHEASRTPLLAFAIIHGKTLQADTTAIVSTLLSHGASPHVIPAELFSPYTKDPPTGSPRNTEDNEKGERNELTEWCTSTAWVKLATAVNITQRYYLERATRLKKPSKKTRQIAQRRDAEGLLGVPYFLIGQSMATELLIHRLIAHLMMPDKRPLVLCFAGPSGHGKTELARQLGHLLSLQLEVVDCTIVKREIELFGPREPYSGAEKGSPLNNFLAEHSGQRCIVFLDEFEKTTRDIHQALLLPFDNGEYQDRRNQGKIDCSNTIWILATNALDDTIHNFCQQNEAIFGDDEGEKSRLAKQLSRQLQEAFLNRFDAPVTGRISDFVPFLPFSAGEQAVVTHRFLLELIRDLRHPVNLSPGPEERLVGDISLHIRRDASVCGTLAQEHYHQKLGARSLKAGSKKIERIVLDIYLEEDEEVEERRGLCEIVIDTQNGEIVGKIGRKPTQI